MHWILSKSYCLEWSRDPDYQVQSRNLHKLIVPIAKKPQEYLQHFLHAYVSRSRLVAGVYIFLVLGILLLCFFLADCFQVVEDADQ